MPERFLSQKMADIDNRFDISTYIYQPRKITGKTGYPGYFTRREYFPDVSTVKRIPVSAADEDNNFDPLLFHIDYFLGTLSPFQLVQDQFAFQLFL